MKHTLPKLSYAYNALEPFIDAKTMEIHYSKHHQTYTDKFNEALDKHPDLFDKKPEELLANLSTIPEDIRAAVRNHGGGYVNHCFFWEILSPKKQKPSDLTFLKVISKSFSSFEKFKEQFSASAMSRFGSGWAWLVLTKDKKLEIYSTANQDSPLIDGKIALLGLDVWEHAYYLKYQNKRADYIAAFWNIINWKKVEENYLNALKYRHQ
ncbi:MAG: superoxide dismutase [Nanoarchaeota archaeon]